MKNRFSLLFLFLALTYWQPLLAQAPVSGFTSTTLSTGWDEAVGLTFNKSGSQMFVWERPGRVWVVENGQKSLLLDIREEVGAWNDHGLLGFALHPQFDTNGYFYVFYLVDRHYLINYGTSSYNPTANDYLSATIGRLTRFKATKTASGYSVDPASRKMLIGSTKTNGLISTARGHVTGSLVFGTDGTLLVSTGDGASGSTTDFGSGSNTYYTQSLADGTMRQKENIGSFRAQMVDCLSGKILRIDPETGAGIPSNPYYDANDPNAPRSKVWALGMRNPFRMSLRPGTGSTNPADANPGTLYVGDVGYMTWEEVSVVDKPRTNLGWPLYEGLTVHDPFMNNKISNTDAPNPLYNTGGCTQQYFYFQDLIKQATPTGIATFPNPCNTSQNIPATIPTFVHTRPLVDWNHNASGPSRTGTFSGSTATTANIGASGSPVSGPQFGGSSVSGGVFYPYTDFPAPYANSYFFGDYVSGWMRNMTVDAANKPSAVGNFVNSNCVVVYMATSPAEKGLYYVNFYPSEIRKITYNGANLPPVAVASSDKTYGPSPLAVQFTGSNSSDPEGQPLSYLWTFGDGTTSTQANPSHTFTAPSSAPAKFSVTLKVTDSQGNTAQAALTISPNNTPPQVTITSPPDGTLYSLAGNTTYQLRASVTDAEHSSSKLYYQWQTFLHHATHEHPEPIDTARETTTTVEPLGCVDEEYYYRIELTVTDAAGLSTRKEVRLNPDCGSATNNTLVAYGATWKYLDNGSDQGSNWRGSSYDDASWKSGPGQLGYGDGDEATVVSYGSNASNKYITTYFRKSLSISNAGAYTSFTGNLKRDDGAIVYVNGTEVYRSNLPTGAITYTTRAAGATDDGATAQTFTIPSSAFVSGNNVIAVEIHQSDPVSSDMSFDFSLTGLSSGGSTNQLPVANAGADKSITLPTSSVSLDGSATDADGSIASYSWSQVSGPNTATFSSKTVATPTVSGLVAGSYVFSLTATDDKGGMSPADQVTVTVNSSSSTNNTLVAFGATWKYLDNGSNQGTSWRGSSYDDASWKSGPSQLGYGDGDEATVVSYGPNASNKYVTTYFRKTINLADISTYTAFSASVKRDDGVVVYVNGTEVYRSNLPTGTITYTTLAPGPASDDGATAQTFSIPVSAFVTGTNVIAVEMHQNDVVSSDLSFDFSLTGTGSGGGSTNQLPVANAGADKSITLPTSGVVLDGSATDSDGSIASYSWSQVSGPNTATFSSKTVAAPTVSGLVAGSYVFSLTATDDKGGVSPADQVTVTVNGATATGSLVAFGATWKYLDNGTNQGTNWRGSSYDDASWKSGPGQLGYGDGDEATVVSYGPNASNKYVTTYFRRAITLADISTYTAFSASIKRDDGVVVYINGTEVYRNNLPAGTVSYTTLAQTQAPDDGATAQAFSIPVSAFVTGTNVIAVEMHQNDVVSSDLSFDFSLTGTGSGGGTTNQLPVANAGADKSITLPTSSVNLDGSASDADGSITAHSWSQVSGPSTATFSSHTVASPTVDGLVAGSYVFSLTATDDKGGISPADEVSVTVNAEVVNQAPVAHAGSDKSITLPENSLSLDGSGTDTDGSIAAYAWTQVSGPNTATFSSTSAAGPTVSGLIAGSYLFSLVVTDNGGLASPADEVSITVNAQASNQPPVANAGADKTITLPTSSATLEGSASDADGSVAAYAWSQTSGPNTATFSSSTEAAPTVSNLVAGTYVFSLTATDNEGSSSTPDEVTVTVNEEPVSSSLIAFGASWKYLDNGTNQGNKWKSKSFNDANWKSGPSELGYGDGDEATVVSYGPNANNKYITTYFRKSISIANAGAYSSYSASIKRDDGVIVYVNGTEVYRNNMPPGRISNASLAAVATDDGATPISFTIPTSLFVSGTNVVAAEIHQENVSSSDISFNLSLTGVAATVAARTVASLTTKAATAPSAAGISVYPNPSADGRFNIGLTEPLQGEVTYTLLSPLGARIATGRLLLAAPTATLFLNFSHEMPAVGMYYLQLESGRKLKTQLKLLRQ
ncbi:PKD domain-containing protein [Hymenobacter sp. DG25A]|uniref:PKD domain-containing protein n=1 Tax=Hymenobacter sp. DG25A TaxID=1385663 RepID=UPI0006C8A3F5|nr:PKD domain-containing protein [Hymenobacter sp. DG25A]